jgi:hypothetical protein
MAASWGMTLGNAYAELGGPGAGTITPPAKPRRHKWRMVAGGHKIRKHYCTQCGTVRTITDVSSRFPIVRFVDLKGIMCEGKTPPCQ